MIYGSVCSGIEAATQAWHPLGWTPAFFSEVAAFPSAVLAHHYGSNLPGEALATNGVPNVGDMTKFEGWPHFAIDLLVGGTPCQSFSIAGLRAGLADPRGSLMLTFGAVARRYRPRWVLWENVAGVLSSHGGRDFGAFLGMLAELGYRSAYRILDAQHVRARGYPRAVPQQRRRVFVVGHLGDWRRAAAVLFDAASLRGGDPPRREAGQETAGAPRSRAAGNSGESVLTSHVVAPTLTAPEAKGALPESDLSAVVAHTLRGEGFDASEDGTGRGTPLVPVAYRVAADGAAYETGDAVAALTTGTDASSHLVATARIDGADWAVRRLTPRECERLQGFPDDFTAIPWRGRPAERCPDGPRYRALGNSMAVNVMAWLGERIARVDAMGVPDDPR